MILLLVLLLAHFATWGNAASYDCMLLSSDGCCDLACQTATCQLLYISGQQLGAAQSGIWVNRTGWEDVYRQSGSANTACRQYLAVNQAGAAAPPYCSWLGVDCNATFYSRTCSNSRWTHGVTNITMTNNNVSGVLDDEFAVRMKQLHDCGLTTLVIGGASFHLHGSISKSFGQLNRLKTLGIMGTNVTGTIPIELGNMAALEVLDLNTNYLVGTLPPELGRLSNLRQLNLGYNGWSDVGAELSGTFPAAWKSLRNLEVLMLDHNSLSGTIPSDLCAAMTKLEAISLGNNGFYGDATQFGNCFSLTALDLSDNEFSGPVPLPNGTAWTRVQHLRINNNQFSGPLPAFGYNQAPQLAVLVLNNNSFTGTIPISWNYLPFLTAIEASFNNLSGSLPWQLALQSRLWRLALNNNEHLTGTLDPAWRYSKGLSALLLSNTDVTGSLPGISRAQYSSLADKSTVCSSDAGGLGALALLQTVNIVNTNMTARCDANPGGTCYTVDEALPWYLNLDLQAWQIPLPEDAFSDNSNMQCPTVVQERFCLNNGTPIFFPDHARPDWDVSPSYYHYLGCRCQSGYIEHRVMVRHGNVWVPELRCEKALTAAQIAGIAVSVSVAGLMLLAYLGYVSWYGRFGLPKLKRAYADVKKRVQGAPSSGKVAVVVTDIESYSELMVAMPLVMGRSMSHHNNVIRKAAWTHFGFVIGQEGDSFILVFQDPLDAVAFCLQVQQALRKVDWPSELLQYLQQRESSSADTGGSAVAPLTPPSPTGLGNKGVSTLEVNGIRGTGSPNPADIDIPSSSEEEFHTMPGGSGSTLWSVTSRSLASSFSGGTVINRRPSSPSPSPGAAAGRSQQALEAVNTAVGTAQHRTVSVDQARVQQFSKIAMITDLIPGLRVRMGIATGLLGDKERDVYSSRVLDVARVVSDAALGGQVLVDSTTFRAVKDRLEELGQVGPSGYTRSSRVTGWGTPRGWLAKIVARRSRSLTAEAQVLDMGLYTVPGFIPCSTKDMSLALPELPCSAPAAAQSSALETGLKDPDTAVEKQHGDISAPASMWLGALALAPSGQGPPTVRGSSGTLQQIQEGTHVAGATVSAPVAALHPAAVNGRRSRQHTCLRLYQVLSPRLVQRAHLFGNRLSLKSGSKCHDLPYFCAPAAANRPTLDADLQQPMLAPSVRQSNNSDSSFLHGFAGQRPGDRVIGSANGPAADGNQEQDKVKSHAADNSSRTSAGFAARFHRRRQGQQLELPLQPISLSQHRKDSTDLETGGQSVAVTYKQTSSNDTVTFVFCSVEIPRAKLGMDTNPKLTAQVSSIVSRVIRECLMAFVQTPAEAASGDTPQQAAGYLCRDLGGDMKYMLAFNNPRVALEWCLLVQEVLLWQDWPTPLLDKPGKVIDAAQQPPQEPGLRANALVPTPAAATAHTGHGMRTLGNGVQRYSVPMCLPSDSAGSRPLFRGPRVKMGVCSGVPQSVSPDHQGRADYHGNAVNMAARFEAICAQGGQVVCEASLAAAVVAEWTALGAAAAAQAASPDGATPDASASSRPRECQPWSTKSLLLSQANTAQATARNASNRVSPFEAAAAHGGQQPQHVPVSATCSVTQPAGLSSLGAGSLPGPLSLGSSAATVSLAAAASIPTAGEALSMLIDNADCDAAVNGTAAADNATIAAAAIAAAAAEHSRPVPIPGRRTSEAGSELSVAPYMAPAAETTVQPCPAPDPKAAGKHSSHPRNSSNSRSEQRHAASYSKAVGGSAGTAGTSASAGMLASFLHTAASSLQLRAGTVVPRKGGRASRMSGRGVSLVLAPAPTQLPCPSCVPEGAAELFDVEVHQVGRFLVKGHAGPVEIVEVVLSHLSARRHLLPSTVSKNQKGRCIEVLSAKLAVVPAVQLPGIAQVYRQQHEQRLAAAAAVAGNVPRQYGIQGRQMPLVPGSLSFSSVQQLSAQQSLVRRTSSLFASFVAGSRRFGSLGSNSFAASTQSVSVAGSGNSTPVIHDVQQSDRAGGQPHAD